MENQDLKYIKKHYGENFARLCRELFPTLLETPGLLQKIIAEKFDNVATLYEDILPIKYEFKNYIYSFASSKNNIKEIVQKSPEELLNEAGYILYPECKTEKDIQKFKKYYASNEKLCTFYGGRLNNCRVWFAVKKNVDKIKRKDFKNPQREDEYGTSVISIQFTKSKNSTLSIKNRYNHTVDNPDATFKNNLDNIISGLTNSFCRKYKINLMKEQRTETEFFLDSYVLGNDGKLYKSNMEIFGANFCANNNVIKYDKVEHYNPSKYLLMDRYLVDFQNKKIVTLNIDNDCFTESIGNIKNIKVTLDGKKNRILTITPNKGEDIEIKVNKLNQIISYKNRNIKIIGHNFMEHNTALENIEIPNVEKIGHCFLSHNKNLQEINLPKVQDISFYFLKMNRDIKKVKCPNLNMDSIRSFVGERQLFETILKCNKNLRRKYLNSFEKLTDDYAYY